MGWSQHPHILPLIYPLELRLRALLNGEASGAKLALAQVTGA
jgi:hypothetical protein